MKQSLEKHRPLAEQYLAEGRVKEILFSGCTYQVAVTDKASGKEIWPFLQLDNAGAIMDGFCSCSQADKEAPCIHMAAAILALYDKHTEPLHVRFECSLWNGLCLCSSERLGTEASLLTRMSPSLYVFKTPVGKLLFSVEAKTKAAEHRLEEIIIHRPIETEENSLKFSMLSPEDLLYWKQGRPNPGLRYELSFWSDLAKWLILSQEHGSNYSIAFEHSIENLPNGITINFPDLTLFFYISQANLPRLIPAFSTVISPLPVYKNREKSIGKITYNPDTASLHVDTNKTDSQSDEPPAHAASRQIGDWIYVKEWGFHPIHKHLLATSPVIPPGKVAEVLTEHLPLIKEHLHGTKIQSIAVHVSYKLSFDSNWALHVRGYIFTPGDLEAPTSRYFDNWLYLENRGFCRLAEKPLFGIPTSIIPEQKVADFVSLHRHWLNAQKEFQIHLVGIVEDLTYNLDKDGNLHFKNYLEINDDATSTKDFGQWLYIQGQGFYEKQPISQEISIHSGVIIRAHEIGPFIKDFKNDLGQVRQFFSASCPVASCVLAIELRGEKSLVITPKYKLHSGYQRSQLRFFGDYVYVKEEGFSELPPQARPPEKYHEQVIIQNEQIPLFLAYELGTLSHLITKIDPRLRRPEELKVVLSHLSLDRVKGIEAFTTGISFQSELGSVEASQVWTAMKRRQLYLFSDAGLLNLQDERFHWLRSLASKQVNAEENSLTLSSLEWMRLTALEEVQAPTENSAETAETRALFNQLVSIQAPSPPDLTGLKSDLRHYQELGVQWLWFLYHYGLSGLLCDDMGLGKTHQAMALLAAIRNRHKEQNSKPRPFIVACPTSVIYHWQDKLKRFLPSLRVCTFYGLERTLENFEEHYDLLLTSYGILRLEKAELAKIPFEVAIFDEIQIAKNKQSQTHAALASLNATMRLGLTGTPIENHLWELKALFDITLPSYMPSDTNYRELFTSPIEKTQDEVAKAALTRLIKPFVLRRKKEDVLKELPEKTEEIAYCELSADQKELYQSILTQSREGVLAALKDDATPIPYAHIFAALTSLKQICNHPAVFKKSPDAYLDYQSGKWDLFVELINEARESNQKVVVFSQYLYMLDIIESHLSSIEVPFASLRGSTTNRPEQIQRFQEDPACAVFVASLQAAGLGIDLTAGSVVIHYDRWWTAARENQATDRVHRIGQKRGVQVFKLVTKGTLEEKIHQIIESKALLMEEIIGTDDHTQLKVLGRQELIEIFSLDPATL